MPRHPQRSLAIAFAVVAGLVVVGQLDSIQAYSGVLWLALGLAGVIEYLHTKGRP
jgi:hypothetical protein